MNILIFSTDMVFAASLRKAFQKKGHKVSLYDESKLEEADLVLSHGHMPSQIKRFRSRTEAKILVITIGTANGTLIQHWIEAGANHVIRLPINFPWIAEILVQAAEQEKEETHDLC